MLLNAVLCVWNEEDIIESTVKHAFAQGCSHVFIIDNCSTDNTVDIAIKAGAKLAYSFESQYFNVVDKTSYLNTVVKNFNTQSDEEHIWWLYLDADEFPNIDCNLSLLDFISQLNPSVRAVHGHMLDHIPTHPPYHVSGHHPIDFMQLCTHLIDSPTAAKIPLLRYDKNKEHLYSAGGAHTLDTCGEAIAVAKDVINIHHFNHRRPENTLSRLKRLTAKNPDGTSRVDRHDHMARTLTNSPDAQCHYHTRYTNAKNKYSQNNYKILMIDELSYAYEHVLRWYDPHTAANAQHTPLSQAIHQFFLKDYDAALCAFSEALKTTDDSKLQLLLPIKIAQCLQYTNNSEAVSLLRPLLKCQDTEVRAYALQTMEKMNTRAAETENKPKENTAFTFDIQQYFGKFEKKFFIDEKMV